MNLVPSAVLAAQMLLGVAVCPSLALPAKVGSPRHLRVFVQGKTTAAVPPTNTPMSILVPAKAARLLFLTVKAVASISFSAPSARAALPGSILRLLATREVVLPAQLLAPTALV